MGEDGAFGGQQPAEILDIRLCSGVGRQHSAPALSGPKISQIATSKIIGVLWITRSPGCRAYRRLSQANRVAAHRWSMTTPLGRPVDPEV